MDENYILDLADKFNAERTWFDGELVSVTFTISHLEKFAEALNLDQFARIRQLEDCIRKLIAEKEAQILGLESKLKEL